jgi:hypothetical protein
LPLQDFVADLRVRVVNRISLLRFHVPL